MVFAPQHPEGDGAVLGLALAACQSAPSTEGKDQGPSSAMMLRLADDTRAGGDPATAVGLYRRAAKLTLFTPVQSQN